MWYVCENDWRDFVSCRGACEGVRREGLVRVATVAGLSEETGGAVGTVADREPDHAPAAAVAPIPTTDAALAAESTPKTTVDGSATTPGSGRPTAPDDRAAAAATGDASAAAPPSLGTTWRKWTTASPATPTATDAPPGRRFLRRLFYPPRLRQRRRLRRRTSCRRSSHVLPTRADFLNSYNGRRAPDRHRTVEHGTGQGSRVGERAEGSIGGRTDAVLRRAGGGDNTKIICR